MAASLIVTWTCAAAGIAAVLVIAYRTARDDS
jgi:hypothetical protein